MIAAASLKTDTTTRAAGRISGRHFRRKPRRRLPDRKGIPHSGAAMAKPARRNRHHCSPPQLLVFAEVKARASLDEAAESINERQRRRIAAAAEVWLAANPDEMIRDIRFDAILVAPGKIPRHIPAAFETG